MYSTLKSVYHRIFPYSLMSDQRGTVYFFLTLLDGQLFESFYDPAKNADEIVEIQYGQWEKRLTLKSNVSKVQDHEGRKVSLTSVLYWFSDWFKVEIVTWPYFPDYIAKLEAGFESLDEEDVTLFGLPWRPENYPKTVREPPRC